MTGDRFVVQLKDKIRIVPNCQYYSSGQFIIPVHSSMYSSVVVVIKKIL